MSTKTRKRPASAANKKGKPPARARKTAKVAKKTQVGKTRVRKTAKVTKKAQAAKTRVRKTAKVTKKAQAAKTRVRKTAKVTKETRAAKTRVRKTAKVTKKTRAAKTRARKTAKVTKKTRAAKTRARETAKVTKKAQAAKTRVRKTAKVTKKAPAAKTRVRKTAKVTKKAPAAKTRVRKTAKVTKSAKSPKTALEIVATTDARRAPADTYDEGAILAAARRLGIERLYAEQQRAIDDSLAGCDVLMVLPTGFGKSACYQIPSMLSNRPVVVISPLLALLRDQQDKLNRLGVPCERLDGTIRGAARRAALERVGKGGPLLVMSTPESLGSADVRATLGRTGVGLAAIDEAHCVSEWGHDFRPSYLRIGPRLAELGSPPVLALTATASPRVRGSIVGSLRMREPTVVASSPHRSNLAFEVLQCERDVRLRVLVRLVQRLRRPGIVYCATRREVDAVATLLGGLRVPVYRYHGGMAADERDEQQRKYMRPGRRSVMVATSAFGLGIDKPDIRYTLHYQSPASLEQYVQEAGRSGRDGKKSNCILLDDPADREIHEALLARSRVRPGQLFRLGRTLAAWAGEQRAPTLRALALTAGLGPRIVSALLHKMEDAGLVRMDNSRIELVTGPESIDEDTRSLAGQFETLRTQDSRRLDAIAEYAQLKSCRAIFLREYFGEPGGEPCELCDACRGNPSRPASFYAPIPRREPDRAARPVQDQGRRRRRRRRRKKRAEQRSSYSAN